MGKVNVHEYMRSRIELAQIYAEDGAFHTAARILTDLGSYVKAHAANCDAELAAWQRTK